MSKITNYTLKHLAQLARIELNQEEEKELLNDLEKIIDYFNNIQKLDTSKISEETDISIAKNVFREDIAENPYQNQGKESFPEEEKGFLKVPKVL
jgi:aspartyl-tRNA(Asn)/glutamyl-tRNA(Gln) amidotransferase subunit C